MVRLLPIYTALLMVPRSRLITKGDRAFAVSSTAVELSAQRSGRQAQWLLLNLF